MVLERTNGLCRTASVRPSLPPVGLSLCRVPLLQALRGARDVAEAGASYATGARAEVAPCGGRERGALLATFLSFPSLARTLKKGHNGKKPLGITSIMQSIF